MVSESRAHPRLEPLSLQHHAMDNIRYIRETMQSATAFTAVPGWGSVGMGATALIVAAFASQIASPGAWLLLWGIEAAFAIAIGGAAMLYKASHNLAEVTQGVGRKFLCNLMTPVFAAIPLTLLFHAQNLHAYLPGLWLILYGTGVMTGGSFSVRLVPMMGAGFFATGLLALAFPAIPADAAMAFGFGVLHIIFGWMVAKNYGG